NFWQEIHELGHDDYRICGGYPLVLQCRLCPACAPRVFRSLPISAACSVFRDPHVGCSVGNTRIPPASSFTCSLGSTVWSEYGPYATLRPSCRHTYHRCRRSPLWHPVKENDSFPLEHLSGEGEAPRRTPWHLQ